MSTAVETKHPLKVAIENKTAVVGIMGLGYVGLPLVQAFMAAGFKTMGFDVDQAKVDMLMAGKSYIGHIPAIGSPTASTTKSSFPRPI